MPQQTTQPPQAQYYFNISQTAQPAQTAPAPPPQATIYQTQSGLTYFSPAQPQATPHQQIQATHTQRIHAPQRRPIPILAPPDHNKAASKSGNEDKPNDGQTENNIDHILDNMFVQRRPQQMVQTATSSSSQQNLADDKNETSIDDAVKVRFIFSILMECRFLIEISFLSLQNLSISDNTDPTK